MSTFDDGTGGVWVSPRDIYDKLLDVEKAVLELGAHRLPMRVTALEKYAWGIPAAFFVAVIGVVTAFVR